MTDCRCSCTSTVGATWPATALRRRYDGATTALRRRGAGAPGHRHVDCELPSGRLWVLRPATSVPAERSADYTRTANERAFQLATGQRPFSEWGNYVQSARASGLD